MIKNKYIYIGLILSCTLFSCSGKKTISDVGDFINYVEDPENGLSATKDLGDFEFSLLYKPVDYLLAVESQRNGIAFEDLGKFREKLSGYQYFTFKIKSKVDKEFFRTGLASENDYYSRLEYFVTYAQDDIYLVEGNDTLPCLVYHFERNYGVSPYSSIVLAFVDKSALNNLDKTFIYNDRILGVGKIALKFDIKDIIELPKLEIN